MGEAAREEEREREGERGIARDSECERAKRMEGEREGRVGSGGGLTVGEWVRPRVRAARAALWSLPSACAYSNQCRAPAADFAPNAC